MKYERLITLLALTGLSVASLLMLGWQAWNPEPIHGVGITIDRLSALLTLLVAAIGVVTYRFTIRYLAGNPQQPRFLRQLALTIASAYVLMCATNLLLLFVAWFLTSLGLHALLTLYHDRVEALRPARKKFFISRLGDVALVGAMILIWRDWGTLDLNEFLAAVALSDQGDSVDAIGLLVAVAALTKSAQFPFHSWLPETMEAPTPVSAIMHAGIINAGGALLLRFAPVIGRVPEVLLLLSLIGTLTFVVGMLAMWAQVKVKRTLAWSTVGQMGFMMVQVGLGAFPVAALHIVGHGCYKAWSFLRSGDLPPIGQTQISPPRALALAAIGTALSVPAIGLASWITGFDPFHSPGKLALCAILAISIGQLWIAILGASRPGHWPSLLRVLGAAGSTVAATLIACGLYRSATMFLTPVLAELPAPSGVFAWCAAVIPVAAIIGLMIVHAWLPMLGQTRLGRTFYMHCLHGFHFGAVADRVVDAVWSRPSLSAKGAQRA
ncbi:MAG: proton-conducting transporter membrane subunit [Planctomycetota bacterium]|nr:proton-conducting transporter membrane subunit [Planctomycetota bacterium]